MNNLQKSIEVLPKDDLNEKEQLKNQVNANAGHIDKLERENEKLKGEISKFNNRIQKIELNSNKEQPIIETEPIIEAYPSIDPSIIEKLKRNDENQMNQINELNDQLKDSQNKMNEQINNVEERTGNRIDALNEQINNVEERTSNRIDALAKELNELKQMLDDFLEKQKMMNEMQKQQKSSPNSNVSSKDIQLQLTLDEVLIELKMQINKQGKQQNEIKEKLEDFALRPELEIAKAMLNDRITDFYNEQDEKHKKIDQSLEELRSQQQLFVITSDYYNEYQMLKDEFDEKTASIEKTFNQYLDNLKHVYLAEKFTEIQQNIDFFNDEIAASKSSIIQLFNLFNQINSGMSLLNEKGQEKPFMPVIQAQPQIDNSPKIQALENKIKALEQQLQKLQFQQASLEDTHKAYVEKNDNMVQKLQKSKLDKTEYNPQVLVDQIQALRDKINMIYNQYQQTEIQVKQSEEDIQNIYSMIAQKAAKIKDPAGQSGQPSGIDEEKVVVLIKKQLDPTLKDLLHQLQEMQKKMLEKATKSDLDEFAKALRDQMEQMKKFADRAETKKSFISLEKKINELFQLIMGEEKDKKLFKNFQLYQYGWTISKKTIGMGMLLV